MMFENTRFDMKDSILDRRTNVIGWDGMGWGGVWICMYLCIKWRRCKNFYVDCVNRECYRIKVIYIFFWAI